MKLFKILIIGIIGLFCLAQPPLKAQTANVYFGANEWYKTITAAATDTTYSTAEVYKIFYVGKPEGYKYIYQAKMTRRNTTGDGTITLYGSIDGIQYYTIETKTWYTSTADTTLYFTTSSNVAWRYLRQGMKGTATGTKLTLNSQKLAIFK
jgi:hypothetical protein